MWKALSDLLPELKFAYYQLLTNKAEYKDRVKRENEIETRQLNLVTTGSNCTIIESGSSSSSNSHDEHEGDLNEE